MPRYKLRAECETDIKRFFIISHSSILIDEECDCVGEPEVIFDDPRSLSEVRNTLRNVIDGHVMVQTVQPIESYTGERDYDINPEFQE